MGDNTWWFNRAGRVAPVSNPGSATPNYGLTYDLATAPYDTPDQFDGLAAALSNYIAGKASAVTALSANFTGDGPNAAPYRKPTMWDKAKGLAGDAWNLITLDENPDAVKPGDTVYDLKGLDEKTQQDILEGKVDPASVGGAQPKTVAGNSIVEAPGVKQVFWGLDKLNEGFSTTAVAASLAEDDFGLLFKSGTWGDAHALTKQYHLNAGEAFVQMFYDNEVIKDPQRFEQIRQHNTVFNVGALAFNVVAAWKADPNVIFGKGLGAARDLSVGRIATNGRTREVQRDILSAPTMEDAKAAASNYSSLADKLRATHAVSMYDRAQQLRLAAQGMGYEQFKNLPAFSNSASGATMAKLMQDVADNDDAWNLVFRSAIGDPMAVGELAARQGEISDKIAAIELKTMPKLQADLERTEARYQKRLAEQGKPQDARIEIVRFGDKWLDDEVSSLRAETEALQQKLSTYSTHESWLQRSLPGLDQTTGALDSNAPNAIFANLDRLGGRGAIRRGLSANGGAVRMWQHDDYSPVSWLMRAPTKPFLKRVGTVSLNDVDEGATALTSYLGQMDYLRGTPDQGLRDNILSRFAGATTDMERKEIVKSAERHGIATLGQKYGLSPELMDKLGAEIQKQRGLSWGKFSDTTIYSPISGRNGPGYVSFTDDAGNLQQMKMPVDVSQLANYYPLTNLTDLDRAIRENMDLLRSLDTELASRTKAGVAWTRRHTMEFVDTVGSSFNSLWKPLALLSIRWPTRVVADESLRVMLLAGVLPHMAQWGKGAGYALRNAGAVRPYEWWRGRKVRTGSLSEESLRPGARNDFDAYDYRAITNPTAAVPLDAVDFGKLDPKRYDALNAATAKRWGYLRSVEARRANVREANKVSSRMGDAVAAFTEPKRPAWATRWDERLAEAQTSAERGFFMDPVSHRATNKGFAVSVYPGRLRTFDRKPTARELNYWTEKNSDLLAIPTNKVAVWLDKDTGRWHMDVVKTTKRREDAMLLARKASATEFYDIEDGFTRFMSEDFYNHFDSPFLRSEPGKAGGVAADQQPILAEADSIGQTIGDATGVDRTPRAKKKVGFGTTKWKSRDGRVIEGEDVYGRDTKNPNIYYSVTSSRDPMRNLFGGYTKGLGIDRQSRIGSDYRVFDPTDGSVRPDEWATAYAAFVNDHIKYSPFWQRMLDGQTDEQIYDWLMGSAEGRKVRQRIPVRGENPGKWVSDTREIFEYLFPNERALMAAAERDLTPDDVLRLIPESERMAIHGDSLKLGLGTSGRTNALGKIVDGMMNYLATVPDDVMVRHPFASTVYNREMRNYLASVPADKITNNVVAAAQAAARQKAVRQIRRTLYNIADEREGVHMLRFVSPFFQAQLEVLERYARISMEKPETVARLAQLLLGSQVMPSPFWQVVDREGNPVKGYSGDNQVTFQVAPWMRDFVDHMPGLKGALDYAGSINVPVASLNMVLQGDVPFLPSMGPLVTVPVSEFYFKDRPELENSKVYKWMFPFGAPQGANIGSRTLDALAPAWLKRTWAGETADFNDSAFASMVSYIGTQQLADWENNGRIGPKPTSKDAVDAAKHMYRLRAASSFILPAPLNPRSPYQFYIDQYHVYQDKYGADADKKFYDDFGPEFYLFAQSTTKGAGMAPTVESKRLYDQTKGLAQRAPLLLGVLTGPGASGEFSDSVYQWQLGARVDPASGETIRGRLTPQERIAEATVGRGWVEYSKLSAALDAELRNRVAAGGSPYLSANSNADLAAAKDVKIKEIIERNPGWQDAYMSRNSERETWLRQAYDVSFDHSLDDRVDIQALRAYLIGRARLQDALIARKANGQSTSDQLSFDPMGNPIGDNADLAYAWMSWVNETKAANPLFAEIYNRYLEGDDLSIYIPAEVSGG